MFSLRRAVFRSVVPGGLYVPPPVLQQNRVRAFKAASSYSTLMVQNNVPHRESRSTAAAAATLGSYNSSNYNNSPQQRFYSSESDNIQQEQDAFRGLEGDQQGRTHKNELSAAPPSNQLFIANVSYGIRAEDLEREFSEFGKIIQAKIIYDPRGLSKGFGYITFEDVESATKAVNTMNGLVVDGRRVVVQYTLKVEQSTTRNEPSRTLFIGNLSFDITDKDLNDMFSTVQNCLDVRVAIDRQTGLPRGFAHADFVDTESAKKAKEFLESKEWTGRKLRIDFSGSRKSPHLGPNDRSWMK